jgi:alkylated DNA repair protein alkB family protein 8
MLLRGGRALVYVWAQEQQIGTEKSVYLRKKKSGVSRAAAYPSAGLPVHENRTNFKCADILVPWKLSLQNSNYKELENRENSKSCSSTYLRFYHVFKEGELEHLCLKVPNISICRSFYDQGNWCVEFKKE